MTSPRGAAPDPQGTPAGRAGTAASAGRTSRRRRAPGRRAAGSGTREAILAAARSGFAAHGYDGATIRSIAADAGVDPALVHHFYGTKERLFGAAMRLPVVPSEVLTAALAADEAGSGADLGDRLIRTALGYWENAEVRATFLGLLRSALTSERAAAMLREFISEAVLAPVARAVRAAGSAPPGEAAGGGKPGGGAGAAGGGTPGGGDTGDAEYRAGMVASQVVGLAITRYLLALGPVASASLDDLAATIGPTLQRYLTGEIRPPRDRA